MTKVKKIIGRLTSWQSFIVIMTVILGLLAFAFKYPEHAPACIKGIILAGVGV